MSQLKTIKLLASGQNLQILEFISKAEFRRFTEIMDYFVIPDGLLGDYLQKLQIFGLIERGYNKNTKTPCGWKATKKAHDILSIVFETIASYQGEIPS